MPSTLCKGWGMSLEQVEVVSRLRPAFFLFGRWLGVLVDQLKQLRRRAAPFSPSLKQIVDRVRQGVVVNQLVQDA